MGRGRCYSRGLFWSQFRLCVRKRLWGLEVGSVFWASEVLSRRSLLNYGVMGEQGIPKEAAWVSGKGLQGASGIDLI